MEAGLQLGPQANKSLPNVKRRISTTAFAQPDIPFKPVSRFAQSGLDLLSNIRYRAVHSGEELEELYRFRYDAYRRDGHILANDSGKVIDRFDGDPDIFNFALWLDGSLVSSIRLQHMTRERRRGVSMVAWSDILDPMLDRNISFIDPSKFVICEDASTRHPLLPHLTLRLAAMATVHFEADYCLAAVRPRHGAFYKRIFESKPFSPIRTYPGVEFEACLFAADRTESYSRVFSRFPFFYSTRRERDALFDPPTGSSGSPVNRTIKPSAGEVTAHLPRA